VTCQDWSGSCRPTAYVSASRRGVSADAGLMMAVWIAEARLPNLRRAEPVRLRAAILDQAEAGNAVDETLTGSGQSPFADPGYGTGFTSHGTMVMPTTGSPGPAIVRSKGDGPRDGASDKVSDNDSSPRST
jgi:hypothetical protein